MGEEWHAVNGTGWIHIPGFGRISPRRDDIDGGRQYFTAQLDNDDYARVRGGSISGGPETWYFEPDQPFLLANNSGEHCLEVQISLLVGGKYSVKTRPAAWPIGATGGW